MTLPDERTRAIHNTREFLRSLLDRRETPRVPMEIRLKARALLKHYPWDFDVERLAKASPKILGSVPAGKCGGVES